MTGGRLKVRLRRALLAALLVVAVAAPLSAMSGPAAVPAPPPAALPPLGSGGPDGPGGLSALTARYAANRADILAAARMAAAHGDPQRAADLRALGAPSRQFLAFDGRDGGRSVEVVGDLAHARRIAVLVPGSDTGLDSYARLYAGAVALEQQLGGSADGAAVVAWLGYATPSTVSPVVLTAGRAAAAAPHLVAFTRELTELKPTARISVLCHSYGSVVCARAAGGLRVADIVLYGSPGVGSSARDVADLHTTATVWAGRASHDWIGEVPHLLLPLGVTTLGLGADPAAPGFHARVLAAGEGGHSDYLTPGSLPLASIARIVTGAADRAYTQEAHHG